MWNTSERSMKASATWEKDKPWWDSNPCRKNTESCVIVASVYELSVKTFFFFFFIFFISEVYPGPIYRFCIKNRSSGQPSITFVSSFITTYIMMGNDMR